LTLFVNVRQQWLQFVKPFDVTTHCIDKQVFFVVNLFGMRRRLTTIIKGMRSKIVHRSM
jgi:hypothetical protein